MRLVRIGLVAIVAAVAAYAFMTRPDLPAAERGRRLAEAHGCFTCHGAAGLEGTANPGRKDKSVPTFGGDLMMYAKNAADVRAWILDGGTERKRASTTWQAERDSGALRMPAFRGRLLEREVRDVVAYVMAASGSPEPDDALALAGLERMNALGCSGCHGLGGRLAPPNPGSLKGYVPSWDGKDFAELVGNEREFGEWVEDGISARFAANPAARWFLDRATLHMPAYKRHLASGDRAALWAYVQWLRSDAARPDSAAVTAF